MRHWGIHHTKINQNLPCIMHRIGKHRVVYRKWDFMADVLLALRDVSVFRDRRRIVGGVSLSVRAGQSLAIVGPNGSGKTTLLLGILGLLPTHGEVLIARHHRARMCRRTLARHVAFVPQVYEGFGAFSVREFVEAARFAHVATRGSDADVQAVELALQRCEVHDLAARPLDTLSMGQRQRVMLAGAVAQESELLLLDEPTAALDPAHQAEFVALLRQLVREHQVGIVWVSHDLNLPGHLEADVLALRDGGPVFQGTWGEFIVPANLRRVYDADFDVLPRSSGPPLIAWRTA